MTLNGDFSKNEYSKFRHFEVQVHSFKNGRSSIPLSDRSSLNFLLGLVV
jgi:hypothetical protein